MNDKNFIEELRQKREEYGVTQTRLAVACGISREYYNRIEKGKQPLNDELREIIEKQIERFNPQEPLFLLIDYFRVRFPTTDALAIIRDVLQLKSNYMLYEDYGKYGYESKYVLGVIRIKKNLSLNVENVIEWCKEKISLSNAEITRKGKNWYITIDNCIITVNAYSYTVITAHKVK
jgi:phage replication initiation protein